MTDYLNFLKNTKKSSDNTIQAYKRDLNLFLEYIKANNIDYLNEEGRKASSISRRLATLRSFYRILIKK